MIGKKHFVGFVVAITLAAIGIQGVAAQALAGRDLPDRPRVSVSYYKVPPGKQDEWLALYKKWHRPIMEAQIKAGTTTSSDIYALRNHQIGSPYDFVIISVSPAEPKPLGLSRGELIRKLFPDIEAYVAGEKHRWELTTDHWDTSLLEINVDDPNPSVYYPLIDGKTVR